MLMYLVNSKWPMGDITEVNVTIVPCEQTVWAVLPSGKRKLVGSYIFFTKAAAERCQLGMVRNIEAAQVLKYRRRTQQLHAAAVHYLSTTVH